MLLLKQRAFTKFSSIAALPPYFTSLGWRVVLSHVVSDGLEHPITLALRTLTDEQVETKLLIWNIRISSVYIY